MKTETELNNDILKITTIIRNEFPELLPFLNEMPVTIPTEDSPEITAKILLEYYESLLTLFSKYAPNHSILKKYF